MPQKSKVEEKNNIIEFKIKEIKKISYFQNDFSSEGLSKSDISKGGVSLSFNFRITDKEDGVIVFLKVNFSSLKGEKNIDLFGGETAHIFEIRHFKKKFYNQDSKKFNIPDNILIMLLNISISGTRGMLAGLCSNPAYSKIIIPIINPAEMLETYKEKNKDIISIQQQQL